ncbi:MAG: hypothetical protein R3175_08540 [Marinobacter sp.]|uniref:hypothetical protein n=1 Tax=Marinobacter sp. TaxID=50741 RepID=UPI00299CE3BA|nr:hypothetical protein [Marinobacter sp.]MDX1756090.1 hypothetical protein [Marinobacter sp.]
MKPFCLIFPLVALLSACGSGDSSSSPEPETYTIAIAESGVRAPVQVAINGEQPHRMQVGQSMEYTSHQAPSSWDWQVRSLSRLQGCAPSDISPRPLTIEIVCQDSLWFIGGGNRAAYQGDLGWYVTDGTRAGTSRLEDPSLAPYGRDVFSDGLRVLEKSDTEDPLTKRFWVTDGSNEGTYPATWSTNEIRAVASVSQTLYLLRVSDSQGSGILRLVDGEAAPTQYLSLPELDEGQVYNDLVAIRHGLVVKVGSTAEERPWPANQAGRFFVTDFASPGSLAGPFPLFEMGTTVYAQRVETEAGAYLSWSDDGADEHDQHLDGNVIVVDESVGSPRSVGLPPVSPSSMEPADFEPLGLVDGRLVASQSYYVEGVAGRCVLLFVLQDQGWEQLHDFCGGTDPMYWRTVHLEEGMLYGISERLETGLQVSVVRDVMEPGSVESVAAGRLEGQPARVIAGGNLLYVQTLDDVSGGTDMAPFQSVHQARVYRLDSVSLRPLLLAEGLSPSVFGTTGFALSRPYTMHGNLLFGLAQEESGFEPWVTDGSVSGTRLLKDLLPGQGHGLDPFHMDLRRGYVMWFD